MMNLVRIPPRPVFSCRGLFQNAVSMLKQEYKEGETDLQTALQLAIKVLSKTLDMTKVTSEKGNIVVQIALQLPIRVVVSMATDSSHILTMGKS